MQKMYTPVRIGLMFVFLAVALTVYIFSLYRIQILQPMARAEEQIPRRFITRNSSITAARGNIYDRNNVLLASGRPSYNIMIDWRILRGNPAANEAVLELVYATMDEDIAFTDTFPVTRGAPFEYVINMSDVQRSRLDAYFDYHNIDPDISVSNLLSWMRNHYKIDYTVGILDARLIIGVRYELEIRAIVGTISPYIFATDVGTQFVAYLEERSLPGIYTESTFVREYHTSHAAHIIGYVGAMTAEEYEIYRERDYPMDTIVGKVGAEYAFEDRLHGSPGEQITRLLEDGTVAGVEVIKNPEPGQHVFLTIDLDLQIVAENALRTTIDDINHERDTLNLTLDEEEQEDFIPGGAVVVLNVNTGEILAAASFPTFDLTTLSENWGLLNSDPDYPMLNRTTQGRYSPGSTFKMVTALAALRYIDDVNPYMTINDTGTFDRHGGAGYTAYCWHFRRFGYGHGEVNIVQAIECSCNYYFLQVSDWFPEGWMNGAELLAQTALEFGLGRTTGLEIPEYAGRLATPEVKRELFEQGLVEYEGWHAADTLQAGFGQGINRFTPVQLANYAATIANGGTLHSLSILQKVQSNDFSQQPFTHRVEILNVIDDTDNLDIIREGMRDVSIGARGTARDVFRNYPIAVSSKTGTVQVEGASMNDGVFVCYAPSDNPEIAISIVVEKGGSGSAIMDIARIIFDHYFMSIDTFLTAPYGDLIP